MFGLVRTLLRSMRHVRLGRLGRRRFDLGGRARRRRSRFSPWGLFESGPEGLDLLSRLVPHCDVVVENFSAGLLERWGLGFDALRALRADVILVRMAGMGQTGPWRDRVTYADALAAAAGVTAETGWGDADPVGVAFGLGDMVAALHAVAGTLEALDHRARTGEGREIDLSQLEAMASHTGTALLESEAGIPSLSSDGNRHPRMAPHGAYPCAGTDQWIAIACRDDADWRALCGAMGNPAWTRDADLATIAGRRAREDDVDRRLAAWTAQHDRYALGARLADAGVPAAPVQDAADRVERDPQLAARGWLVPLPHRETGSWPLERPPFRLSDADVHPGGRILGDVRTGCLVVKEGAVLEGGVKMGGTVAAPIANSRA